MNGRDACTMHSSPRTGCHARHGPNEQKAKGPLTGRPWCRLVALTLAQRQKDARRRHIFSPSTFEGLRHRAQCSMLNKTLHVALQPRLLSETRLGGSLTSQKEFPASDSLPRDQSPIRTPRKHLLSSDALAARTPRSHPRRTCRGIGYQRWRVELLPKSVDGKGFG